MVAENFHIRSVLRYACAGDVTLYIVSRAARLLRRDAVADGAGTSDVA